MPTPCHNPDPHPEHEWGIDSGVPGEPDMFLCIGVHDPAKPFSCFNQPQCQDFSDVEEPPVGPTPAPEAHRQGNTVGLWTLVVNDIAYTPTRALGIYFSQELAELAIQPWMLDIGVAVLPLSTAIGVVGVETPYWPPVGELPRLAGADD